MLFYHYRLYSNHSHGSLLDHGVEFSTHLKLHNIIPFFCFFFNNFLNIELNTVIIIIRPINNSFCVPTEVMLKRWVTIIFSPPPSLLLNLAKSNCAFALLGGFALILYTYASWQVTVLWQNRFFLTGCYEY